jgi:hypothetical protein
MDMTTIFATVTPISLAYFFFGILTGYILRANLSDFRGKKHGRYRSSTRSDNPVKQPTTLTEADEPSFELPDSVLKGLIPRRSDTLSMDKNVNEC